MTSVLQDWLLETPLRAQGTVLTGARGCDLTPKLPLDSTERHLVAYLRWLCFVPADEREVDAEPGCFFISKPPENWKASELGHYPLHWVSHLMHCYEVVGHLRPHAVRLGKGVSLDSCPTCDAYRVYSKLVKSLHLNIETKEQMLERLTEDRIIANTVVS